MKIPLRPWHEFAAIVMAQALTIQVRHSICGTNKNRWYP